MPHPPARPLPRFPASRAAPPRLPVALTNAGLALRVASRDDLGFLNTLYGKLRAAEFALAPWGADARAAILRDQFELQHRHFLSEFPRADYWIVERAGAEGVVPIGRYYLNRHGRLWRAIDLGFLPGKRGFGFALLNWTKALAAAAGVQGFDFHVAHDNARARALYLKMGFRDIDAPLDFHQRMIWLAEDPVRQRR
jgi:hypothetical protein